MLWRYLVLNIYHAYVFISRWLLKIFQQNNNKLAIILNKKIVTPLLIVIIALAVVTNNLAAKETTREDFGRNSILFSLVEDEFGGHQIIEDKQPAQIINTESEISPDNLALSAQNNLGGENTTDSLIMAPGGSALIQQNLIASDQARTRTEVETYTVQPGDTVSSIAATYGLSVNTILWANNLSATSLIRPGNTLKIPPQNGLIYTIARGDTIRKIAETYQADELSILDANTDLDPNSLAVGKQIFIPDGVRPAPKIAPISQPTAISLKDILLPTGQTPDAASDLELENKLLWPAKSRRINQYYSWRHRGLDIDGDTGDPAYAPEAGKVERAGWSNGYGYNVVINHGNGIKTLQGHFSKILVEAGDTVERGDVIALIGSTGWSTGPHIHFEVIINGAKTNPFTYTK